MNCAACEWDDTRRYENRLISEYVGYLPVSTLGNRPAHTCGRPTLTQMLNRELILAINTFRISSGITRDTSSKELKRCLALVLDELEMER